MRLPSPGILLNDLLIALSLLTRLPLPRADWSDDQRPAARAAWAYPLAGLVVGGLAALTGVVASSLGLGAGIVAVLMLAVLSVVTGAMHEDGLADCADGFWGGWETARRLEIMKDSAIGTYGVLAIMVVFALKWGSVAVLLDSADVLPWIILVPAIMSRAAMVAVMELLPHARKGGLSATTGKPGRASMMVALGIGLCPALFAPAGIVWLVLVAGLAAGAVSAIAMRKISGQTGDVLGACQSVTEAALLVTLCALI